MRKQRKTQLALHFYNDNHSSFTSYSRTNEKLTVNKKITYSTNHIIKYDINPPKFRVIIFDSNIENNVSASEVQKLIVGPFFAINELL